MCVSSKWQASLVLLRRCKCCSYRVKRTQRVLCQRIILEEAQKMLLKKQTQKLIIQRGRFALQMSPSLLEFAKLWPREESKSSFPMSQSKGKHSRRPDAQRWITSLVYTIDSKTVQSCPLTELLFWNKMFPE